jgi:hypothetical protein
MLVRNRGPNRYLKRFKQREKKSICLIASCCNVNAVAVYLKFVEEGGAAVGDGAAGARQRLHHVGERATRVVHELEVLAALAAAHALEEERHGLLDGEADELEIQTRLFKQKKQDELMN